MVQIFKVFISARVLIAFLGDALVIAASYVVALYLNLETDTRTDFGRQNGWEPVVIITALLLLGLYFRDLYRNLRIRSRILMVQELCVIMGLTFLAEALFVYLNLGWGLPRRTLLVGSAIALPSIFTWRLLVSVAIRRQVGLRRVLFVGLSPIVCELMEFLGRHPEIGFAPIGYLEERSRAGDPAGHLGLIDDLDGVVARQQPDWIVIGRRDAVTARAVDEFLELRFGGIQIDDAGAFYERARGRVCASEIRPEAVFSEALRPDPLNLKLQSMYSVAVALLLAPLLAPAIALIALAVRLSAHGALWSAEPRVGIDGVPFTLYRFACPPNKLGRMLQRSGLDALPQIWNILSGQMSLVGPRADRPEFAELLNRAIPFYAQRNVLLPGITGWAQIHELIGESRTNALVRLEYDLYYARNLSPLMDLFVLLRWIRSGVLSLEKI